MYEGLQDLLTDWAAQFRRLRLMRGDLRRGLLDDAFREMLHRQTLGHPLFTIELLHGLQEQGDLVQDSEGCWVEGEALDWETLPTRVEAVIAERISRLAHLLQAELRVASVEGEGFTAEVIARVRSAGEGEVVGGIVVLLVNAARRGSDPSAAALSRGVAPFLPFFLSMAMTVGVAPLLFVQVLYGQFCHFPCTEEQYGFSFKFTKDLPAQLHGGIANGNRMVTDTRFASHPLGH